MIDDQNPYLHPAYLRFQQLLDDAEDLSAEQMAPQPLHDPLQPYHVAAEWGIDPWVARMVQVDQALAQLRAEAVTALTDRDQMATLFKEVAVGSLQALILFEETENTDALLDDEQLAAFLDKLVETLDHRIARLRRPQEGELDVQTGEEEFAADEGVHLDEVLPPEPSPPDPDVKPGLAFTEPYPATVAGEGPVQDPPARPVTAEQRRIMTEPEPGNDHDGWLNHADELTHRHNDVTAPHFHESWNEVQWVLAPPVRQSEEPVDLDAAERGLVKEMVELRHTAGGSGEPQVGGRHASPDDTQPDLGETGRRARED